MTTTATQAQTNRSNQQLDSLEIRNFRAFESLSIERLGKVNLIIGKNSVGKSALLDALRLYAMRGAPEVIGDMLVERDEWSRRRSESNESSVNPAPVNNLFSGRPQIKFAESAIQIGPVGLATETLTLEIGWFVRTSDQQGQISLARIDARATSASDLVLDDDLSQAEPRLVVQYGNNKSQTIRLDSRLLRGVYSIGTDVPARMANPAYVPVQGLSSEEMAMRWDQISVSMAKQSVIEALRIVAPDIENLDIIGRVRQTNRQIVIAKLTNIEEPIPVRSLGEGMIRLFGLALALVTAQDTMLLVDEVDTGLHYSVQLEMWRIIFTVAERLNIQVFATTHSWDCVAAFQQAAEESQKDGLVIRLEQTSGVVTPVLIDEKKLAIVTREQVEIR
jgi:ABC-type cobalamin/Fe3+-siderophores transport system ATPase subunit